jgi:hypothetical protein
MNYSMLDSAIRQGKNSRRYPPTIRDQAVAPAGAGVAQRTQQRSRNCQMIQVVGTA